MTMVLVGIGGFFGAGARSLVDGFVSEGSCGAFPWGTLVINLPGRSCSVSCSP